MDFAQFRTILWLRWRLAVNQWTRGGGLAAIVATLLSLGAILTSLATFAIGFFVGSGVLTRASPDLLLIVWDIIIAAFLFFWIVGIASELQRSEIIDLPRLMHLPVSLRGAFLINYLASHATLSLIIVVPAMAGLITGLVAGRGWSMALLALPAFGLIFAVTAWTYCLRGWLSALMLNARRRRAIIVWVTIGIMLIAQGPNLYFNLVRDSDSARIDWPTGAQLPPKLEAAHNFVPPLWVGLSARSLAQTDNPRPALFTGLALFVLAGLGIRVTYGSTLRFYAGKSRRPVKKRTRPTSESTALLERTLPLVSAEISAVATASFRCITRAPEFKMALGSAVAMVIVFGVIFLRPGPGIMPEVTRSWALFGAINLALMIANQLYANQFGADRDGFRAYVLAPLSGRELLLGKNLALLPLLIGVTWVLLIILTLAWQMPTGALVRSLIQAASAAFLVLTAGNITSIYLPYHMTPGTLRPSRTAPHIMVALIIFTFILPLLLLPVAAPMIIEDIRTLTGQAPSPGLTFAGALVSLPIVVALYWLSLGPLGRSLDQRKLRILQAVTRPVE